MSMFRAYGEEELPNLLFKDNKGDAFDMAVNRLSEEAVVGGHPQKIIIEEVREPKLSDFFDFDDLASVMAENMQARIGNSDAFTDEAIAKLRAKNLIGPHLDSIAKATEFRIDGYIVVNRFVIDEWWVKATDE